MSHGTAAHTSARDLDARRHRSCEAGASYYCRPVTEQVHEAMFHVKHANFAVPPFAARETAGTRRAIRRCLT